MIIPAIVPRKPNIGAIPAIVDRIPRFFLHLVHFQLARTFHRLLNMIHRFANTADAFADHPWAMSLRSFCTGIEPRVYFLP
jgi:hypothetical protein